MSLRLVIVDDHPLVRAGIRADLPDDFEVVGEADDVDTAVSVIADVQPDVVLLDVHLPGGNAGSVLAQLGAQASETRFLALSVSDDAEDVIGVVRRGARGYVTKNITAPDLADAIRRVAAGEAVFSPKLAGFVLDAFRDRSSAAVTELDQLTPRERDVMRLIARGDTYREAADELFLSVKTIETHMSAVLRKLQLSNRRELARWARAHDLL
ncbi:MAG: response regulator transcription factor [Actinobacteria bacterium]|nr:response regulator transcription factor [Actinomycetota bacterium]